MVTTAERRINQEREMEWEEHVKIFEGDQGALTEKVRAE